MKRLLKILTSWVLMLSMITVNIVYAGARPGSNATGGGGYINPSGSLVINGNGIIFGLEVTDNTISQADKDKIEQLQESYKDAPSGKTYYDQIGYQTVSDYLYHYPDFLCDVNITKSYGLIVRDNYASTIIDLDKQFLAGGSNGQRSATPFVAAYRCNSKGSARKFTTSDLSGLASDTLRAQGKLEALLAGEVSLAEVKAIVDAKESAYLTATSNFVKQFTDTASVADNLKSLLPTDRISPDDEEAVQALATYLDFVTLIYFMTDKNAQSEYALSTYLKNLNKDGADSFVTFFMASVVSYGPSSSAWDWYTLPNYYSYISGASVDKYQNIVSSYVTKKNFITDTSKAGACFSLANEAQWIQDYYNQFKAVKVFRTDGSFKKYSGANKDLMWWSKNQYTLSGFDNWKAATMLMPTDMWGDKTGTIGFTYFNTSRVVRTTDPDPKGSILLHIDEDKKVTSVEKPGTKTSTTVVIDLTSNEQQQWDTFDAFEYAKKKNVPVRVTIELSAKTKQGTPNNSSNFDTLLMPSTLSINSSNKIVWDNVTWEEFEPYMKGEKVLKWNDADITVNNATKIEYYATLLIEVVESPVVVKGKFTSKGEEKNTDRYKAQTSWTCTPGESPTPTPDPDITPKLTGSYHSTMEEPYVEIKEGTPGHETFEAMAGVPTLNDLYVAFGATEFMLNLEVEQKTSEESMRTYELKYTASRCYDVDDDCIYTCGGHTVDKWKNGCGRCT